jgi:hypothetical protein
MNMPLFFNVRIYIRYLCCSIIFIETETVLVFRRS